MRASDIQTVRELPLFAGMGDGEFDSLMKAAFLQRFPAPVRTAVSEAARKVFAHRAAALLG